MLSLAHICIIYMYTYLSLLQQRCYLVGGLQGLELMTSAFVRRRRRKVAATGEEIEDDGSAWVQECVLTVLRVEHLPACMDGDFDAMVAAFQVKKRAF